MAALTRPQHADRIYTAQLRMQQAQRAARHHATIAHDACAQARRSLQVFEMARKAWDKACTDAGALLVPQSTKGGPRGR